MLRRFMPYFLFYANFWRRRSHSVMVYFTYVALRLQDNSFRTRSIFCLLPFFLHEQDAIPLLCVSLAWIYLRPLSPLFRLGGIWTLGGWVSSLFLLFHTSLFPYLFPFLWCITHKSFPSFDPARPSPFASLSSFLFPLPLLSFRFIFLKKKMVFLLPPLSLLLSLAAAATAADGLWWCGRRRARSIFRSAGS